MKSQRPYLFDAIYRWIIDSHLSPYLLLDANNGLVKVPSNVVNDGQVVLNLAPQAIAHFQSSEQGIEFSARFAGKSEYISVPYIAMIALYARENGQGIVFPQEVTPEEPEFAESGGETKSETLKDGGKRGRLKVIK